MERVPMDRTQMGRVLALATAIGSLLWLLGPQAHANGMAAVAGAVGLAVAGVVALLPAVAVEAIAYGALLAAPPLRSWLSALLGNVAAVPFTAVAVFCLAVARWDWPYRPPQVRAEALVATACVMALIAAKLGITWAMLRKGPTRRPIWHVALGVSAVTTALVIGVCMACYHLD